MIGEGIPFGGKPHRCRSAYDTIHPVKDHIQSQDIHVHLKERGVSILPWTESPPFLPYGDHREHKRTQRQLVKNRYKQRTQRDR